MSDEKTTVETASVEVPQEDAISARGQKKGLPAWAAIATVVVCLAAIYGVFQYLTREPPVVNMPAKPQGKGKGAQSGGGPIPGTVIPRSTPVAKPGAGKTEPKAEAPKSAGAVPSKGD